MKIYLLKLIFFSFIFSLLLSSCEDKPVFEDKNYKIIKIIANGHYNEKTTTLTITFDKEIPYLCADDILINTPFSLIKKDLKPISSNVYELGIIPGKNGKLRIGLDPYRGFTGWRAATVFVYTDYEFEIKKDENNISFISIIGYNKQGGNIEIPDNIDSIPVTSIGDGAFYNKKLTSVKIPNSVTEIGNSAFYSNKLEEITIHDNIKNIGNYAFYENIINELNFSSSENELVIGNNAFAKNKLTAISIPDNVKQIGEGAFKDNDITEAVISKNITVIEAELFMNNELTTIAIPDKVVLIKSKSFFNNKIETLYIRSEIKIETFAFWGNNFKEVIIGSNVTLEIASINEQLENHYNKNGKQAGIYTWVPPKDDEDDILP